MKNFTIILLFLISTNSLCQCFSSENEFKEYFNNNIQDLDPIEGIWSMSVTVKRYAIKDISSLELLETGTIQNSDILVIIKKEDKYVVCFNGKQIAHNFTKTAIQGKYLFNTEKLNTGTKYTANVTLSGGALINYAYYLENEDIKELYVDKIKESELEAWVNSAKLLHEYTFIKIFPNSDEYKPSEKILDYKIDYRNGTRYKTVKIGDQWWMAENLSYLPEVYPLTESSITEKRYYVYDYNGNNVTVAKETDNYLKYGVLYNWKAAIIACPNGWHLPSEKEWQKLIDYLGGDKKAGGKMKESSNTHWENPNKGASNISGFSVLPAGMFSGNPRSLDKGYFWSKGFSASLWTSTEFAVDSASFRSLNYYNYETSQFQNNKTAGLSVRCIRDY